MKNFLPRASSGLNASILTVTLLIASVANGEQPEDYTYNPSADFGTKLSNDRKIAELNYMQPFFAKENSLPILDLKLKLDNKQSKEVNLGLVYRYNYEDKAILGSYVYFDHRRTGNNFSVNGLTVGAEVLSKYIDARVNIYAPQNKRKKIKHNNRKIVKIEGTSIFAISGGHKYESSLKGYDIEVGTPLFAFLDSLNEQFGTKIYAARYSFTAKNIKPIRGIRFRVEQDLKDVWLGDNRYKFYINAETQFDKVRKRQNFIGLGLKVTFNDKKNSGKKKPGSLNHRMMETVIRDVDIVTRNIVEAPVKSNFYMNGREIKNIYFVGRADNNYSGSGTKDNPFSFEQLKNINYDNAVIIVTSIDPSKGGTKITPQDYAQMQQIPQVVNGKKDIVLSTGGENNVSIRIDGTQDILISGIDDKNTSIFIKNMAATTATKDNLAISKHIHKHGHRHGHRHGHSRRGKGGKLLLKTGLNLP